MTKGYLFSSEGRPFLLHEYNEQGKSTYVIAAELGTYANVVRRALLHHGIQLRSHSEAQQQALKSGRTLHPTRGRPRPEATKERISQSLREKGITHGA